MATNPNKKQYNYNAEKIISDNADYAKRNGYTAKTPITDTQVRAREKNLKNIKKFLDLCREGDSNPLGPRVLYSEDYFFRGIKDGRMAEVKACLRIGYSVDHFRPVHLGGIIGITPLEQAMVSKQRDIFCHLLECGAIDIGTGLRAINHLSDKNDSEYDAWFAQKISENVDQLGVRLQNGQYIQLTQAIYDQERAAQQSAVAAPKPADVIESGCQVVGDNHAALHGSGFFAAGPLSSADHLSEESSEEPMNTRNSEENTPAENRFAEEVYWGCMRTFM